MIEPRVAILIDADNISGDHAHAVLEEAGKQGRVVIRRIYADWTSPQGKKWKSVLADLALMPVQQFANTVGKNATDSALIIDAMDLLHRDAAEVFCIVSSDADFTRLAARLREDARTVVGIGARKTPRAFVQACDRFIFTENLRGAVGPTRHEEPRADGGRGEGGRGEGGRAEGGRAGGRGRGRGRGGAAPAPVEVEALEPPQDALTVQALPAAEGIPELTPLLHRAYEDVENDDGFAYLGTLGSALAKLDPAFDSRTYGFRKLVDLVVAQPGFSVSDHATKNTRIVKRA